MATVEHPVASEEVMAYLDGELSPEHAALVNTHVSGCTECQEIAARLRHVSRNLAEWDVSPEPPMTPPVTPERRRANVRFWGGALPRVANLWALGAVAILVIAVGTIWVRKAEIQKFETVEQPAPQSARADVPRPVGAGGGTENRRLEDARIQGTSRPSALATLSGSTEAAPQAAEGAQPVLRQKIVQTVELSIVAKEFSSVRPEVERILHNVGGFVGQMDASGETGSIDATLRIPADRLENAVVAFRALGRVVHETRSADDVTEQSVDLEARLTNSRNTEKRLIDVLQNRTGKVGDVLEVEREIARVREEIERLDAERTNLERRVTYATVTLHVSQQRQATLDLGPMPLRLQIRNAFVDGIRGAADAITGAVLWLLRSGPVLLLWVAILWWPARRALRAVRARPTPDNAHA
jgi:uncharacterized small protein (DUF1192 family)